MLPVPIRASLDRMVALAATIRPEAAPRPRVTNCAVAEIGLAAYAAHNAVLGLPAPSCGPLPVRR